MLERGKGNVLLGQGAGVLVTRGVVGGAIPVMVHRLEKQGIRWE